MVLNLRKNIPVVKKIERTNDRNDSNFSFKIYFYLSKMHVGNGYLNFAGYD